MKSLSRIVILACAVALPACGSDGSELQKPETADDDGGACQLGTAGCGCDLSGGCAEGDCIAGRCVDCKPGEPGCVCNEGYCDSGACVDPDPGCQLNRAAPICEGPAGGGACGPVDLCTRSIDGCGTPLTQNECEGWYAQPTNCHDMDAYTACNCACLAHDGCATYFSCGQLCFQEAC